MMDDLKDSGMWLDWAEKLEDKEPGVAKFLCMSAKDRIENSFPQTKELFNEICHKDKEHGGECLKDTVEDHLEEWYKELVEKLKKF